MVTSWGSLGEADYSRRGTLCTNTPLLQTHDGPATASEGRFEDSGEGCSPVYFGSWLPTVAQ
jgi:hypothetical protein